VRVIEAADVHRVLEFPGLIDALRATFAGSSSMPRRMVFRLDEGRSSDAFALLPAWTAEVIGVKAFTYLPGNAAKGREILHSKILLFDRESGRPLDLMDGTSVTYWRTAAVAALAADYLARSDATRLLVCGTGHLAPFMALANASVRPVQEVGIWGRNRDKAARVVEDLRRRRPDLRFHVIQDLEAAARRADMISCATGSRDPLIFGAWVQPGTHVGLFGNHDRDGRECDTPLVEKSKIYVDSRANVLNEAGEILIPIAEGRFREEEIVAELSELCSGGKPARANNDEITLFKSVGTALSDLAAARLVAKRQ